jgi:DNA-binding CsgD family transcriptional regulator
MGKLQEVMLQPADARDVKLGLLTPQERECLRLVAQQRSSKEIAHVLGISKASVDTYCNRARAKLGVNTRRDAAQLVLNIEALGDGPANIGPTRPQAAEPDAVLARASLFLPPISSLGPLERLGVIMVGAVLLTLSFGMLVSGLQSLNDAVGAAHARANLQVSASTR